MRLIHTFDDQKKGLLFSHFLGNEGIENQCEVIANTDWGSPDYGTVKCLLWIVDEDAVAPAQRWLDEFSTNPENPIFHGQDKWKAPLVDTLQSTIKEVPQTISKVGRLAAMEEKRGLGLVTLYLLMACVVIFIYGEFTKPHVEAPYPPLPGVPVEFPSIYKALMYDYPQAYEIIDKLVKAYGVQNLQNLADLPLEGRLLLEKYTQTPYWEGIYGKVVFYFKSPKRPWNFNEPLFEKIREGEFWRVFTPILLHGNVLHLFFNIIWLVVLGKVIEDKLGSFRFLLFVLFTSAVSNTAQYLMSGSDFIGISGLICAMLGFIWARQRVAAWEGYNLTPGIISFMFIFIIAIAAIQLVSFFLQVYWNINFMPGIANTAHITGALAGYLLGRMNIFSIRFTRG